MRGKSAPGAAATMPLLSYERSRTVVTGMREEITFVVEKDEESDVLVASWDDASGQGGITTQGADLKELQETVGEAVRAHFDEAERPARVRLHFVTDPILATA